MKKLLIFVLFFSVLSTAWAQTTLADTIDLKDSTIVRTIPFTIQKGSGIIKCSVKGYLTYGELSFRIIDPEGKREGGFMLDAMSERGAEPVRGRMTHEVPSPLPGIWRLEFKATRAAGDFNYTIYFK